MTTLYFPVGLRLADGPWDHTHTRLPWKHTTAPRERWVYVLAKTDLDARPWLYAEVYFDAQSEMRVLDMDQVRSEPGKRAAPLRKREERRALAEKTGAVRQLPILCEVLGKSARYWVWGSPFALEQAGLELVADAAMRGDLPFWTPDTEQVVGAFSDVDTRSSTPTSLPYVPIFDAAHIASKIHERFERYQKPRTALLHDEALGNQVMLARLIMAIGGFSGLKVRDDFKGGAAQRGWLLGHASGLEAPVMAFQEIPTTGADDMKELVKGYDEKLHAYTRGAEKVSKALCAFLETPGFRLFERTASEEADGEGAHYAQVIGRLCQGLGTTEEGKRYLSDALDSDSWFVRGFIAPEAPRDFGDRKARTEFEAKLLDWYKAITEPLNPVHEYLSNTVMAMSYADATRAQRVAHGVNMHVAEGARSYEVHEVSEGGATGYVLEDTGPIAEEPGPLRKLSQSGGDVLAVVNLHCTAMKALIALESKQLSAKDQLELCGAIFGVFEQTLGIVGRPFREAALKKGPAARGLGLPVAEEVALASGTTIFKRIEVALGVLGAATSLAVSLVEFAEAREDDVRLGKGISCVGAAAALVCAMLGGPAAWVAAASLLGTTGSLIAHLCQDSPLELLVRHSTWGERYGQPADPPVELKDWMRKGFVEWAKPSNKSRSQLEAMTSILSGFTVSAARYGVRYDAALRIDCGLVPPGSRFRIVWSSRASATGPKTTCTLLVVRHAPGYRVLSEQLEDITGRMKSFVYELDPSGRSRIKVSVPKGMGFTQELWCEAKVSLELPGGRLKRIPDRPLSFARCIGDVDKHDDPRSSLEAPFDRPEFSVARYAYHIGRSHPMLHEEVGPNHVGAPVEIRLKHVPPGAELRVHWSVGNSAHHVESRSRWDGTRWQQQDPSVQLRMFSTMPSRVRISFPRAVKWRYKELVTVRAELLTATMRHQAPALVVYDGQRASSEEVASAQT